MGRRFPAPRSRSRSVAALLAVSILGVSASAGALSPRVHYVLHCQGCHLADGRATPGKIPALSGSVGRFLTVPGGREFLVRVPGTAQAPLADEEIAALLNWMIDAFGPDEVRGRFDPYTAEEVGAYRGEPLTDVEGARRRLMESIERSP